MNLSHKLRLQFRENPGSETEIKARSCILLVSFPGFAADQC